MATEYIDQVERTHRVHGRQISEAAELLRIENPLAEFSPGYAMLLETKVQEITNNPKARLIRTEAEEYIAMELMSAKAKLMDKIKREIETRRTN